MITRRTPRFDERVLQCAIETVTEQRREQQRATGDKGKVADLTLDAALLDLLQHKERDADRNQHNRHVLGRRKPTA